MKRQFEIVRESGHDAGAREEPLTLPLDEDLPRIGVSVPYVLSREAAIAVNTALAVDQPLLVTGEPGCGKTSLAHAVARQLGAEVEEFHVKSTSVARDLLYSFDSVRRFHDASIGTEDSRDPRRYVALTALGRAIASEATRVVLIDEIDKAHRDFPNDLLHEIDRKWFVVQETGERYAQKCRHFVLVTSNGERRLPDAFLRRCVYLHLPFPDAATLRDIVRAHAAARAGDELVNVAISRLEELRSADLEKRPATSELLAWLVVLSRRGVTADELERAPIDDLPGIELLLKLEVDRDRFRR
jgi:MoxR-like ATPase